MNPHDSVPGIHTGVKALLYKTLNKSYAAAETLLLLQSLHKTTFLPKKRFELERQRKSESRVEWFLTRAVDHGHSGQLYNNSQTERSI